MTEPKMLKWIRSYFEEFARAYGFRFQHTYDPFYDSNWIFRFVCVDRHCEYTLNLNSLYFMNYGDVLANICVPVALETLQILLV